MKMEPYFFHINGLFHYERNFVNEQDMTVWYRTVPTFPPIGHRVCSITFFDLVVCIVIQNVGLHNHKSFIAISTNGTRN